MVAPPFPPGNRLEVSWDAFGAWLALSLAALALGIVQFRGARKLRGLVHQLAASEERWKHALEGASQAAWDWNAETGEVYFSPSWKAMLGYEPDEIGTAFAEWESRVHPEDLPRVLESVNRHLEGHTPAYVSEHRLRCKDGSYKWVLDQGKVMSRTPDGKPRRVLGTDADIDQRKRIEAEMRQWADAFRFCAHGIAMTTADSNRILVCNPALAGLLGRSVDDVAGLAITDLHVPDDHPAVAQCLAEADQLGQVSYQARQIRSDGSTFPAQVDVVSVRDDQGFVPYRITTVQDISARRQAEKLQALSAEVLRILDDAQAMPGAIQRILDAIQRDIGVDAVGIRLRQGNDFPYASSGFSPSFVESENCLLARAANGDIRIDDQGSIHLECTCGLVLSGRKDDSNDWLTPEGSAWTK